MLALALVGIIVIGVASALIFTRAQQPGPAEGTLDWYAEQASLGGFDTWEFGSGIFEYVEPNTWDDVLATQSLVVAEPLEAKSYPNFDNTGIWSWWRFRIHEVLSQKDVSVCYSCSYPTVLPADFPAAQPDQLVLRKHSGSLWHNGIWLEAVEPSFAEYQIGQKYLLILDLNPQDRSGSMRMGPLGVYRIDSSGMLTCVCEFGGSENPYKGELTARYGNSLANLRAALTGVPGPTPTPTPTPTSSCNPSPTLIQKCENNGGMWDFESCRCN